MHNPDPTPRPRTVSASAEAIIGIGITVAALGTLCLLLGFAQSMRAEHHSAVILLPIGGIMLAIGAVTAMMGHSRKRR